MAEASDNSPNLQDYLLFVFVSGTFSLYQFALLLSYSFVGSIVNHFSPHTIKGGNYALFLGLSGPGEGLRCSASTLALLASFLNSVALLNLLNYNIFGKNQIVHFNKLLIILVLLSSDIVIYIIKSC